MTNEQFVLLNKLIDTVDQVTGKLLMGADRNGQLIYVQKANLVEHGMDSNGRFRSSLRYPTKDPSGIKAAFRYNGA